MKHREAKKEHGWATFDQLKRTALGSTVFKSMSISLKSVLYRMLGNHSSLICRRDFANKGLSSYFFLSPGGELGPSISLFQATRSSAVTSASLQV